MRRSLFLAVLFMAVQVEIAPEPFINSAGEVSGPLVFTANATLTVDGNDLGVWKVATGTLTATQVRKLNATPVEVIAAPGSGKAVVVESVQYHLDYGGTAFDSVGAGEDLVLETQTNLHDHVTCDSATCLSAIATSDVWAIAIGPDAKTTEIGMVLRDNKGIQATILSGEWATTDDDSDGNSPIHYIIRYREVTLDLS